MVKPNRYFARQKLTIFAISASKNQILRKSFKANLQTASAVCDFGFLIWWASSRMTRSQMIESSWTFLASVPSSSTVPMSSWFQKVNKQLKPNPKWFCLNDKTSRYNGYLPFCSNLVSIVYILLLYFINQRLRMADKNTTRLKIWYLCCKVEFRSS